MNATHTRTLVVPLAAAALLAGCAERARAEPFSMISIEEVERLLGKPQVAIVDANGRELYEKHHLPGARHLESAGMDAALPPDRATKLVFYCASPK